VKDGPISSAGTRRTTGLTRAETQAIYQLVVKRPTPAAADEVPVSEAMLVLAAGLLKGYDFEPAAMLAILARLWTWLDDDAYRAIVINVIDRRYVGWSYAGDSRLFDTATGEEIPPSRVLPVILESVAYNIYELLERRAAMARGERASLWEVGDAAAHTAPGEASAGRGGLDGPHGVRDDAGDPVP
jgi:hypothetical protein